MIFGVILKMYQLIVPFILRTAMLRIMGTEYVGLNSLFKSILQVLNMTELGVGTAMVFSMYRPIAEDDKDRICALMRLYKIYYRIIGLVIAVVGLAITPIVPKLIKSDSVIPLNLTYLYWLNLGYTVLSYWLFAYKNCILQAHQRTDIASKVNLVMSTLINGAQLLILILTKNYYLYLLALLIGVTLTNICVAIIASKLYPEYKAVGTLEKSEIKSINQRVKDLFTSKVGGVVQNSADSIVISMFLGLTILGQYNNYYYIMNSVFGIITIIFASCMAGIGNSLVLETPEKNYSDLKTIALLVEWVGGFSTTCLICLYQPFIFAWAGTKNMLSLGIACCLGAYLYIIVTNQMLCLYKDAAGIWHEDRFRPLITALANLVMNLVSVQFIGLYGVVLSTVVSLLVVGMPWLIHNLFSTVFHREAKEFVKALIGYAAITVISCVVSYQICRVVKLGTVATLAYRLGVCLIIPNLLFFLVYRRSTEFRLLLDKLNSLTHGKFSRLLGRRKHP